MGSSGSYQAGTTAEGGSTEPVSGHSYSTNSGTSRGGFGFSLSGEGGSIGVFQGAVLGVGNGLSVSMPCTVLAFLRLVFLAGVATPHS